MAAMMITTLPLYQAFFKTHIVALTMTFSVIIIVFQSFYAISGDNDLFTSQIGFRKFSELYTCLVTSSPSIEFIPLSTSGYNDSRVGTNFRYDNFYPIIIVNVSTQEDVVAAVKCGGHYAVEIVVMNGGHSFEGMSCTNGILLNLDSFNNVISDTEYNAENKQTEVSITVQSGMRLGKLYGEVIRLSNQLLQENERNHFSYVLGGGTCPTVGVAGHVLCGGYGMLGRRLGLTSDQVIRFEVITPQGDLIQADSSRNTELYWALRGSCSSGFGIITSITFKLYKLNSANVTMIDCIDIPYRSGNSSANAFLEWWQLWSSEVSPYVTSTVVFSGDGFRVSTLVLSNVRSELSQLVINEIQEKVQSLFIHSSPHFNRVVTSIEGTFLDAVVWWSHDDNVNNLHDLLSIKSLPSLDERVASRRKTKSLLVRNPLIGEPLENLILWRSDGFLNAVEWKAYNGYNSSGYFTDFRSPLQRGHRFEMHLSDSYSAKADDTRETLEMKDRMLVENVNKIGQNLSAFIGDAAYVGYIDFDLSRPNISYFGYQNAITLSSLRQQIDPEGILQNRAVRYLFP
jgi:hypothetical protein